jgi:hypothetical protein
MLFFFLASVMAAQNPSTIQGMSVEQWVQSTRALPVVQQLKEIQKIEDRNKRAEIFQHLTEEEIQSMLKAFLEMVDDSKP